MAAAALRCSDVLIRFLVRDDEEQFERARRFIRRQAQDGEPVHINLSVLLETEWVLRSRYKLTKGEILGTFSELLSAADLSFEDESSMRTRSSSGRTRPPSSQTV